MTDRSELARQLAALRQRTTIICEICGTETEVWARKKQQARTCSLKCRQKLWRNRKRAQDQQGVVNEIISRE